MAKTIKKKENQTEVGRRKLFVKNIFICTFGTTNLVKKLHMGKDKMPITRNVLTEQIKLKKKVSRYFSSLWESDTDGGETTIRPLSLNSSVSGF